ncbi:MAG: macro domain-containing protein [Bacteroidales bacterium]|nr:macro domain-containing protein [Bacteroidales bacterium]
MIQYIEYGDIFNLESVNSYAHGCNCAGAMGKGIALQFRNRFPKMYCEYKELCKNGDFNLGDIFVYNYGNGYVFNLGTQKSWKSKAEISAIEQSLKKMLLYAQGKSIKQIALPKIGAGLGGLEWDEVKEVMEEVSSEYPGVRLVIVMNYKKEI